MKDEPLNEAFIPTRMLFREGQLQEITRYFKSALHKKDARNILLTGPTGTGKTSRKTLLPDIERADSDPAIAFDVYCSALRTMGYVL